MLRRTLLCTLAAFALTGCATGPRQVFHSFDFDGWNDGWYNGPDSNVQLQEYSYGDQYRMVRKKVQPGEDFLPPRTSVSGPMPVGEFLYVRWRLKSIGEMVQHRVDLRDRLPRDMKDQRVSFVIGGKDLYVCRVQPVKALLRSTAHLAALAIQTLFHLRNLPHPSSILRRTHHGNISHWHAHHRADATRSG